MDLKYLRTLAHDLKGPVGNTLMFSDMFRDQLERMADDHPELSSELERIQRMAQNIYSMNLNMSNLIDSWVDSYKILSNELEADLQKLKMHDLIHPVLEDLNIYFNKKNITLTTDIAQDLTIKTDQELVSRAVANLLLISVTFAAMGATVKLDVKRDEEHAEMVKFSVIDFYAGARTQYKDRYLKNWELGDLDTHNFDDGIVKPTAFGLVYVAIVVNYLGGVRGCREEDELFETWFSLPL